MKYECGAIIRYVQVEVGFDRPAWYIDPNDEVEIGDWVNVQYRYQEREGIATNVVRCVYPHVVFPAEKTKEILEIAKASGQK